MSDEPRTAMSMVPYATPGALERVETRGRDDRVTLQKTMEREIANVRELIDQRIALHQDTMELRIKLEQKALELQAAEVGRRLDELNHNHAQREVALARTVQQDVFAAYQKSQDDAKVLAQKEFQNWKDSVNQSITQAEAASKAAITQAQASNRIWMAAISIILTLVGLALRYIGP